MSAQRKSSEIIPQVRRKVKVLLEVADKLIESLEKEDWDDVENGLRERNRLFNQLHKLEGSLALLGDDPAATLDGALPLLIAEMGDLAGREKVLQTKLRSAIGCIRSDLCGVRSARRLNQTYSTFQPWSSRFFDKIK